jgi:integrase
LNGFSDVSRQWLETIAHLINARTHRTKTSRIERLAFPVLGNLSIKEINSVDVMAVLKPIIERRQLETAHRLHSEVSAILAYAIAILEAIKPLTSHGQYVFPSRRGNGRLLSDNAIRAALQTLGYDSDVMTAYGVRTTASTLLNEQGWSPNAIERQLAHAPRDHVRAAYNRAHYLDERRRMMQAWADYLDALKKRAEIIPFR